VIVPPSWEGNRIDYALEAAERHPDRFAVMGRIALNDPKSKNLIPTWLDQPGMLGIRVMVSREVVKWLEDGTTDWFWPAAEAAGIPLMIHAPGLAPAVAKIAEAHPRLRLIVDHMNLSSDIKKAKGIPEAVATTADLARYPNISVKVSSVPSYSYEAYPFRDMKEHLKRVIGAFGPRRSFWGSDFTHAHGKATYRQYVTHFTEELDFLSKEDKKLIMGDAILAALNWH
ncbi:MAG TPA: amidohydrolase family protein, partial [Beijerinckiaceae bacterium]|nr:amidohydrolase family protein [Beijerinckiaceae bacterium]